MDRNYCLIVFIVYMSYSDTQKVAKCCLYVKKSMGNNLKKKKKGATQGPVHKYLWAKPKIVTEMWRHLSRAFQMEQEDICMKKQYKYLKDDLV